MNASEDLRKQIKLTKAAAENHRKMRDMEIEESKGKATLKYVSEQKYAPILEATKASSVATVDKLTNTNQELMKHSRSLALNNNWNEYLSGQLEKQNQQFEVFNKSLSSLQGQPAIDSRNSTPEIPEIPEETNQPSSSKTPSYVIPEELVSLLGNRSSDSLCITFDETTNPPTLKLGNKTVQSISLDKIKIGNLDFPMTRGAWILLTKGNEQVPLTNQKDRDLYSRLLWKTGHVTTKNKNGKTVYKSSRGEKWAVLSDYGIRTGKMDPPKLKSPAKSTASSRNTSASSNTSELDTTIIGEGFIENDVNKMINRLWTTLLNLEAGHTNISNDDINLASEIVDILYKKQLISLLSYRNIYRTLTRRS